MIIKHSLNTKMTRIKVKTLSDTNKKLMKTKEKTFISIKKARNFLVHIRLIFVSFCVLPKVMKFLVPFGFILVLFSVLSVDIQASEFNFDTQTKTVSVEEKFKVDLNVNTEKENINAVGGKIIFPTDLLELSEIREGNSIVNFWVEKPNVKDGVITFSGITPGGYVLDKGLIISLVFKAKSEGNALIKIENGSALLNDGNGTESNLKTIDLQINISNSVQKEEDKNLEIIDKTPPEIFQPEVSQDPNLLSNRWFVVFVAQDKGMGIDRYEIKESKNTIFSSSKWVIAESPYILADQELKSDIYVKAVDRAGNERVIKLSAKNGIPWYQNINILFIIILILMFIFFFKNKLWNRNKHE